MHISGELPGFGKHVRFGEVEVMRGAFDFFWLAFELVCHAFEFFPFAFEVIC